MRQAESFIRDDVLLIFVGTSAPVWIAQNGTARSLYGEAVIKYGQPGQGDIFSMLPPHGRACWIETKTESGRLSPAQQRFRTMCERAGALYLIARSGEEARAGLIAAGHDLWKD